MNKELTVTRSNHLVKSSYFLTLNERRLIECSIAKIKNGEAIPSEIKITAEEFAAAWDIPKGNAFKELQAATKHLRDRLIKVHHYELQEDWEIRWVDGIGYRKGQGYVKLSFSQHVRPYLEQLKGNFTRYKLLEIKGLKTNHSIRLYELMMQYKATGYRLDTVDGFKKYFGVDDKYELWSDFNKWVLSKAIKEVNRATNYEVSMKPIRKGRSIHQVELSFTPKDQYSLDLA